MVEVDDITATVNSYITLTIHDLIVVHFPPPASCFYNNNLVAIPI